MTFSNELKVGLAVLAAVAIFFFGIRYFQDKALFGGGYSLETYMVNSGGLAEGNAVTIRGVNVGSVSAVNLDPETQRVRVRFHLDDGIQLPRGTYAQVAGLGALSGVSLSLIPGPPENTPLPSGATIPSRGAGDILDEFARQALQISRRADTALVSAEVALDRASRILELSPSGSTLPQALNALRRSALTLEDLLENQRAELSRTLENAEAATADLRAFTDENTDSLGVAVDRLNHALARVNETLDVLTPTVHHLNAISAKIDSGQGTLGKLVNDPSLYAHLDSAAARIDRILADFEAHPARYLRELSLVEVF